MSCEARSIRTVADIELAAEDLQQAILQAYHQNCRPKSAISPRSASWWNLEISELRKKVRRLFNKAKGTGHWEEYKASLTQLNKAIRRAKRSSWKEYCQNIEGVSEGARIMKIMSKSPFTRVSSVRDSHGNLTDSGESTLKELLKVHFPDSKEVRDSTDTTHPSSGSFIARKRDWEVVKEVVNYDSIRWAMESFKPFKAAGPDGIVPACIQRGIDTLTPGLCRIYRACLAFGYVPETWRRTRVTFIPKAGKDDYTDCKTFRPICMS